MFVFAKSFRVGRICSGGVGMAKCNNANNGIWVGVRVKVGHLSYDRRFGVRIPNIIIVIDKT